MAMHDEEGGYALKSGCSYWSIAFIGFVSIFLLLFIKRDPFDNESDETEI